MKSAQKKGKARVAQPVARQPPGWPALGVKTDNLIYNGYYYS